MSRTLRRPLTASEKINLQTAARLVHAAIDAQSVAEAAQCMGAASIALGYQVSNWRKAIAAEGPAYLHSTIALDHVYDSTCPCPTCEDKRLHRNGTHRKMARYN